MQTRAGFLTLRSPDRCLEDRVHLTTNLHPENLAIIVSWLSKRYVVDCYLKTYPNLNPVKIPSCITSLVKDLRLVA